MVDPGHLALLDPGPTPDVTVVVCAYGRADLTLACLRAIARAQLLNDAGAEVIVVDDGSPDDAAERVAEIPGVRLLRSPANQGYLRAANKGMAAARGRDVVLLNNDTEPVGPWLDALLDTRRRHPRAALVGARLLLPDGRVQEAGGIIFNDGSGWNFGRRFDGDDWRVTYEREVDYCSAACLLVTRELLDATGGFDERYAPAYYEDTDLAFQARSLGWEVWYQPDCVVLHHEGGSYGVGDSSASAERQRVNREIFRERWLQDLELQHRPGAENVGSARDRSPAGRIVVIDREVPTPDEDSGSVREVELLRLMRSMGFAVTFVALSGWRHPPYAERLEAEGIEVLAGIPYPWEHIGELAAEARCVWVSRPDVASDVVERLRAEAPSVRIVYDTVDLHFLREERAARLSGDADAHARAVERREQELQLARSVDATVVVSDVEAEVLRGEGVADVHVVSNIHREAAEAVGPRGRSGLLFVGNFRHAPNADGIAWFVSEVLPLAQAHVPDVQLRIVGPEAPPEVLSLASDHVDVVGWLPDLREEYSQARVVVAPLRFGAGVKGKVGEAFALGVPVALTPVAAEGLGDSLLPWVGNTAEDLAAVVVGLLLDDEAWWACRRAGRDAVAERLSVHVGRDALAAALGSPGVVSGASAREPAPPAPMRLQSLARESARAVMERLRQAQDLAVTDLVTALQLANLETAMVALQAEGDDLRMDLDTARAELAALQQRWVGPRVIDAVRRVGRRPV